MSAWTCARRTTSTSPAGFRGAPGGTVLPHPGWPTSSPGCRACRSHACRSCCHGTGDTPWRGRTQPDGSHHPRPQHRLRGEDDRRGPRPDRGGERERRQHRVRRDDPRPRSNRGRHHRLHAPRCRQPAGGPGGDPQLGRRRPPVPRRPGMPAGNHRAHHDQQAETRPSTACAGAGWRPAASIPRPVSRQGPREAPAKGQGRPQRGRGPASSWPGKAARPARSAPAADGSGLRRHRG